MVAEQPAKGQGLRGVADGTGICSAAMEATKLFPVVDVGYLVGEDAAQFTGRHAFQQSAGDGDHTFLRISTGGKGIRLLIWNEIEPWLGNVRPAGQILHHVVEGEVLLG